MNSYKTIEKICDEELKQVLLPAVDNLRLFFESRRNRVAIPDDFWSHQYKTGLLYEEADWFISHTEAINRTSVFGGHLPVMTWNEFLESRRENCSSGWGSDEGQGFDILKHSIS